MENRVMKKVLYSFIIFFLLFFAGISHVFGEISLVFDNQPKACIIMGKNATETERYACKELQLYIERSSSAQLPIMVESSNYDFSIYNDFYGGGTIFKEIVEIIVGTPASFSEGFSLPEGVIPASGKNNDQAYRIRVMGNKVFLIGNSPRAALWACYTFLEDNVGVRWIKPGPDGEIVPPRQAITIPTLDKTYRPALAMRGYHLCGGWYPKADIDYWMARMRMNVVTIWGPPSERLKMLGLETRTGGHVFPSAIPEALFKEHPEYFSMINGKRDPMTGKRSQRCYSNPEARKLLIDYICKIAAGNDQFAIFAEDTQEGWCECPECKALDVTSDIPNPYGAMGLRSNLYISYLNMIADELFRRLPNTKFYISAYLDYILPPTKVKPDKRYGILYADMQTCKIHGYEDLNCPLRKFYSEQIKQWISFGCPLEFYSYYSDYDPDSTGVFRPWVYLVAQDAQFLREIGAEGLTSEIAGEVFLGNEITGNDAAKAAGDWFNNKATYYILPRVLWNPDLDISAELDDIYKAMYGSATVPLRKAYQLIEDANKNYACGGSGERVKRLLTEQNVADLIALFDEARRAVPKDDNKLRFQVEREISMYNYWIANAKRSASIKINRTKDIPKIEAKLDDPAWEKVSGQILVDDGKPESRQKVSSIYSGKPEFRCTYDSENFYVRAILPLKDPAKLNTAGVGEKRDNIKWDTPVEIFVALGEKGDTYYQIAISPANIIADSKCTSSGMFKADWNAPIPIKSASRIEGNTWIVDVAIPAQALEGKTGAGEKWRLLVYCNNAPVGWPYPKVHKMNEFGAVEFCN